MVKPQISLRQYVETIKEQCQPLHREELVQIILGLAKEVRPNDRSTFLQTLSALSPEGGEQVGDVSQDTVETIIHDLELLRKEILNRVEAIEDGSYWDNPDEIEEDDWQDDYYMDEDPDMLSFSQMSALSDFFGEADHLFFQGDKDAAEKIYRVLISLVKEIEEFGFLPDSEIGLYEARARFARCVYDVSSQNVRVSAMMTAMNVALFTEDFETRFSCKYPLLKDVIDAETGDLADFDTFLSTWKTALAKCSFTSQRTADLLLEATYMDDGLIAVGALAQKWREKQPLGYLYWFEKLENQKNWHNLRDGAIESLKNLPHGGNRRKVSSYLITAGEKLGENNNILAGYRERFRSKPGESSLLDLVEEATRQQVRAEELEEAIEICSTQKQIFAGDTLLTKALLMAGQVDQAHSKNKETRSVGWSNSTTGLLFASTLYLLTEGNKDCSLIHQQFRDYSEGPMYFDSLEPKPRPSTTSCFDEIVCGFKQTDKSSLDLSALRKWAGTIGESRINHIVSNKHRRAYSRAATVLGSLAELMAATGDKQKAANLLHEYCKVLYNRHVAFRREVKTAVGRSVVLRGMGAGL